MKKSGPATDKFTHFVFTRYNYGLSKEDRIYNKKFWLKRRARLFENTAQSMVNQTNKNFVWMISFEPSEDLAKYNAFDAIRDIDYLFTTQSCLDQIADRHIYNKREWIITTRLDNDDLVEPTFIEEIQNAFREKEEVIDVDGRQLDLNTGKYYTSGRDRPNSPFLSLAEKDKGELKTCFYTNHTHMPDHFEARRIEKKLYTQVIHDDCLMNRIVGEEIHDNSTDSDNSEQDKGAK